MSAPSAAWQNVLTHLSELANARAAVAEADALTADVAADRHARALVRLGDAMLDLRRQGVADQITDLLKGGA